VIDTAFTQLEPVVSIKGACAALGRSRATLYRSRRPTLPRQARPRPVPRNALAGEEQAAILGALHQARFLDRAPAEVYAVLLDEGTYLGSASTMYRVLHANDEVRERRALATHPPRKIPELLASEPNRVWSYDDTHLRGPARGVWYFLFAMLDIFSRYVPGHIVLPAEEGEAVKDWIDGLVRTAGPNTAPLLTIHADNGGPMISKPVSVLLGDLHIERSHSRPHVSNDNPYSEAGFKTLKYCPSFPSRSAASRTPEPSAPGSSTSTTTSTGTQELAITLRRRSTSAPQPRSERPAASSSRRHTRPIRNASLMAHPRRHFFRDRPGSTSRRRILHRSSAERVSQVA
jgi:putative transposase